MLYYDDEEYFLYTHKETGLMIVAQGPLLFDDWCDIFTKDVSATERTLKIEKGVCVTYQYCDCEHRLFVDQDRKIFDLLSLVNPALTPHIQIDPEYFKDLLEFKRLHN
jgi:hypothetical protein